MIHDSCLVTHLVIACFFFFFNDTATTEIYPLSLHDALPILGRVGLGEPHPQRKQRRGRERRGRDVPREPQRRRPDGQRSEEHTSELQSQSNLVCRLLLEKKKKQQHPSRAAVQRSTLSRPCVS